MRVATACTAGLLLILVAAGQCQDPYAEHVASTQPRSPEQERKLLQLPPGFEAQLVAAEPDIQKPLNLAFDDHGRLWVSDTVEYPFPAPQGRKPRDTVKILEDFGPDGRARKITTFADGLNIPIGVLPLPAAHPQEALSYSIPNIWRLRDETGQSHATSRQRLYSGYGFRDTHGMTSAFTLGFDGWVYACHGYSNTSTVKGRDGRAVTMQSGNTYRTRPDGSQVEWFTHGQVNPFGLTLDPLGNLYSADCHTRPLYLLLRGAYYPSFGKPHDGLGFGPEMVQHDHGSTAIAGITWYAADAFPPEYQGTMFVGNVVTNRINHDRLQWHGSSPQGIEQPDFLVSGDPWFRPVDIKLGPDGALYVADFYNRIIGHYEVPLTHPGRDRRRGRIWRIVYRGHDHHGTAAPRTDWTTASATALVQDLAHPNLAVRMKATNQLVERGTGGADAVQQALADATHPATATQWAHGLWVLQRCGALDGATLAAAARHDDRLVRVHAQRLLAEHSTLSSVEREMVLAGLKDPDAHVRRAAADALGRHPDPANIRPLLELRHRVPDEDTHLLHVVRMALRNQLLAPAAWAAVAADAIDERDARAVADVSLGVQHAEAANCLLQHLRRYAENRGRTAEMVHHVARYGSGAATAGLLEYVRGRPASDLGLQAALCRAVYQGVQERGRSLTGDARAWAEEVVARLMAAKAAEDVQAGIELVGGLKLARYEDRLATLAAGSAPAMSRLAALDALMALEGPRHAAAVGAVLADAAAPIEVREHAAELLGQANQPATREQLLKALPLAPARLQNNIAAALSRSRAGAEGLLEAVAAGKASARLLQEWEVALRLTQSGVADVKARVEKLTAGLPRADQRLQELLRQRHEGFARSGASAVRGKQVFAKNCATCHQIGNEGVRIGPQLDGIGIRGLDRLLEDVLDPNRNVDQAFRLTTLELKKGQIVSGLLLREEGAVYVLADAQGKEVRVSRDAVAQRTTSQMSPMPADFADKVSVADFYDLFAYLLDQRPRPEGAAKR
jgi:putative heme-binding domain-containing protein